MGKRLFVGNLPFSATENDLRALFSQHGNVTDVHIVLDRESGRSRGFAFVSYGTDEEAAKATDALNGKPMGGRPLVVKDARDRGAPAPPGERPPRPMGDRPMGPRPMGDRPMGPRPGGPAAGGPSRPWSPRPPRGPMMPPDPGELPPETERRRTGFGPKKRRPEGGDDRALKAKPRVEEVASSSGNWRQWMNEFSDEEPDDDLALEERLDEDDDRKDDDEG